MQRFWFSHDRQYSREQVIGLVGGDSSAKGGPWFTGYREWQGAHFIFCNVGSAGRTGHNYGNRFVGDRLIWSGKTGSRRGAPSIVSMTAAGAEVHLFYREDDRAWFSYAGLAVPDDPDAVGDDRPVTIRWRLHDGGAEPMHGPDEVRRGRYTEGAVRQVLVNAYEREPRARADCISHWGCACCCCGFDFGATYGAELGAGFIHVHHLRPLALLAKEYVVDPVADLRPVCPNCHAMLHRAEPPLTIEALRERVQKSASDE